MKLVVAVLTPLNINYYSCNETNKKPCHIEKNRRDVENVRSIVGNDFSHDRNSTENHFSSDEVRILIHGKIGSIGVGSKEYKSKPLKCNYYKINNDDSMAAVTAAFTAIRGSF